jgi:hypothetical protein
VPVREYLLATDHVCIPGIKKIAPDVAERRGWLLERGAVGRMRTPVKQLMGAPGQASVEPQCSGQGGKVIVDYDSERFICFPAIFSDDQGTHRRPAPPAVT